MKKGYYITANGNRVVLEPKHALNLQHRGIIELVIPEGVKDVFCQNNQLTNLIMPQSVNHLDCRNNQITELILTKGAKTFVNCKNNQITNLKLPKSIVAVFCDITALDINKYKNSKTHIILLTP